MKIAKGAADWRFEEAATRICRWREQMGSSVREEDLLSVDCCCCRSCRPYLFAVKKKEMSVVASILPDQKKMTAMVSRDGFSQDLIVLARRPMTMMEMDRSSRRHEFTQMGSSDLCAAGSGLGCRLRGRWSTESCALASGTPPVGVVRGRTRRKLQNQIPNSIDRVLPHELFPPSPAAAEMDFQVVVLAGGTSKNLHPIVSKELPKALLPVANRPVLSYVLELLESSNLKNLIVVSPLCLSFSICIMGTEGGSADSNTAEVSPTNFCMGCPDQDMNSDGLPCEYLSDFSFVGVSDDWIGCHNAACGRLTVYLRSLRSNEAEAPMLGCSSFSLSLVVEGEDAALRVGGWISAAYVDRLSVEVAAVPEDVGTAGVLRAVTHLLTATDILVVSGDLISDVPLGAVAATHRRHAAVVTALLCAAPVSGPSETGDKAKKTKRYNIIGLDPTRQFLLFVATGAEVEKDLRIRKSILRSVGKIPSAIGTQLPNIQDVKQPSAVLYTYCPYSDLDSLLTDAYHSSLISSLLECHVGMLHMPGVLLFGVLRWLSRSELSANGCNERVASQDNQVGLSQNQASSASILGPNGSASGQRQTHKCCAYIAGRNMYCARLDSIQAFSDINRDVIGEANHLSGYSFSAHNNIIHPSAELGSKTTVGPHCMLGEGSQLGDKCSVKRSAIGRHCRIGSNVKIVNSVVMNHVTIEDGCLVQGSVICSNVHLQERVVLKDCQVGAGFVVTPGSEYKAESLAKKEKTSSQ
ncbi:hypothetical protein ACLOJK_000295 [Asimina triloba]